MPHSLLFGERSLTTVAALFGQARDAQDAAEQVVRDARLPTTQVKSSSPDDPAAEQKLEPPEMGIRHTLLRSHAVLGIVGLVIGLLIAWLLISQAAFAASSPDHTLGVFGGLGLLLGLMTGGLVTRRPDRGVLDVQVEQAVQDGQWAVVVHPIDRGQGERARDALEHSGGKVFHSL